MTATSQPAPDAALEMLQATNREMARRAKAPRGYHLALGLLMGGLVACYEARPPLCFLYYLVMFPGLFALQWAYRRHTGMWINGYRAGRTRWVIIPALVAVVSLGFGCAYLKYDLGFNGAMLAGGVVTAAIMTFAGFQWEKAYRRDLGVEGDL